MWQQNILPADMIYMKWRLDAHFYYIFVAVTATPPATPIPLQPLLAGSALILCYAPRHGKGNSCAARQGLTSPNHLSFFALLLPFSSAAHPWQHTTLPSPPHSTAAPLAATQPTDNLFAIKQNNKKCGKFFFSIPFAL